MKIRHILAVAAFFPLLIASADGNGTSAGGAVLDEKVLSFLGQGKSQGKIKSPARLAVLIRYKAPSASSWSAQLALPRQKALEFLKARSLDYESRVFASVAAARSPRSNLWIVQGTIAELGPSELEAIAAHPLVQSISSLDRAARLIPDAPSAHAALDGPDAPDYTYGLSKIRVPELRAKDPARDGRGIRVGIIDTGIDPNHPALVGKAILFKNFVGGQGPAPTSRQDSPQDSSPSAAASAAFDDQGHGTHVAGTIAGSNSPDQAFGVAPGAQLIIGKAFGASGEFSVKGLLASMQWMADPDGDPATDDAPHLVSNSWTADIDPKNESPSDDPLCAAVDTWVKLGIIPVFAIGNDGPKGESIGIPAACPGTVAVGASDDRDEVPQFSSRGPARWKSSVAQKPDIVAPGQDIVSAAAGGGTTAKSGTSMAAPHVAGALALLLQGLARQDDARVEQALIQGADKLGQPAWNADSGNGRIDLVRSLELLGNK